MENRLLNTLSWRHRHAMRVMMSLKRVTKLKKVEEPNAVYLMSANEPGAHALLHQKGVQTGSLAMMVQCVGAAERKRKRQMYLRMRAKASK